MVRRLAGTAILMITMVEAIVIQIVAARSRRAWIVMVTQTMALLTQIAARSADHLVASAAMIVTQRIVVLIVDHPARREDMPIMGRTMDRRIGTWDGITDRLVIAPTATIGRQAGRETIADRTADLLARREDTPIVVRTMAHLTETWVGITDRLMTVAMETAGLPARTKPIAARTVDHLGHREDMLVADQAVGHPTRAVGHPTQTVAPTAVLLARHASMLIVVPTVDLLVREPNVVASAALALAIVARTAAGPIRAEKIDAMTISGRNGLNMATAGLRGSTENSRPTPEVLSQSNRGVLTRFSRLHELLEGLSGVAEQITVVGGFNLFADKLDVEESVKAGTEQCANKTAQRQDAFA
jgi:hypothetical protein